MFGLKEIEQIEWSHESYQFDLTGVWVDEDTKVFYWSDDVGCSCPTPFEDLKGREMMEHGPYERLSMHLSSRYMKVTGAARNEVREQLSRVMTEMNKYVG